MSLLRAVAVRRAAPPRSYLHIISDTHKGHRAFSNRALRSAQQLSRLRPRPLYTINRRPNIDAATHKITNREHFRDCSSEASSSLIKMASDRDVLPDEYVYLYKAASIPANTIQRQTLQLRNLPLRSAIRRAMDVPRSGRD